MLLVFTLPVEILLVELLVPWDLVRWILFVVAVAGTLWAIGVIVSIRTLPHRVTGDALELRYGALGAATVPIGRSDRSRCHAAHRLVGKACPWTPRAKPPGWRRAAGLR